jgi:uncharacterized protein (TIGR00645 family)
MAIRKGYPMPDDHVLPAPRGVADRMEAAIEALLLGARWTLVPLYLGMSIALLVVAFKFLQKLVAALLSSPGASIGDLVISMLSLVDLSLVANLVLMVMLAGYANFVSPFPNVPDRYRPRWLDQTDFGALKLKLLSTIVAIAAVGLLETYVKEAALPRREVLLHVAMLLGFGLIAVLMAVMDRLAERLHDKVPD